MSEDAINHIRKIARLLYGARYRCSPRAKPKDRRTYRGVTFDFPDVMDGARLLYERLGPIPSGQSLDRINSRLGYSASNIRYATMAEQIANRRFKSREQWELREVSCGSAPIASEESRLRPEESERTATGARGEAK